MNYNYFMERIQSLLCNQYSDKTLTGDAQEKITLCMEGGATLPRMPRTVIDTQVGGTCLFTFEPTATYSRY